MTRFLGIDELVLITLRLEHFRHVQVRKHPVVQAGARGIGAVVVLADLQPEADRLVRGGLGDEILVVFPRAVRSVGAALLIDERTRVDQHSAVKLRMEPRHR